MVWIKILSLSILLLFFSTLTYSNELSEEEEMYFNFVDLNNDGIISYEEIEQSLNIMFQIIDQNQDNNISQNEIYDLTGRLQAGLDMYTDMMNMEFEE